MILRYGAISSTAEPGLGFKLPLIDSVVRISVQSKAIVYEKMEACSRDQQPADIRLSVNYRKDNPGLVSLTQAERWDGQLPRTMLPGGVIPMLNLNAN